MKKYKIVNHVRFIVFLTICMLILACVISKVYAVDLTEAKEATKLPSEVITQETPQVEPQVEAVEEEPELISLGNFTCTAYCACMKCCGKTDGITATGTKATAGRTIAVDPKVIPYGSTVIIKGIQYVAEDCGGAINDKHIDIYFDTHEEALKYGVQTHKVFLEK